MLLSHVPLAVTPWTVASAGSSVNEILQVRIWSGFLFPSWADLLDPGIESRSPALKADSLPYEPPGNTSLSTINLENSFIGIFQVCGYLRITLEMGEGEGERVERCVQDAGMLL